MQHALLIDVETTGLIEPQVIQLATKGPLAFGHHLEDDPPTYVERYKPTKDIEPGAMATHRIIPSALAGCAPYEPWTPPEGVGYLIGYGVDYDWKAVGCPGLKRIDVMAMAKRVWDGLGSYKQTAVIFHLFNAEAALALTEKAHDAEQDVYLTALVLEHLLGELEVADKPVTDWESLWQFSEDARIPLRIGFSKYGPKNGQPGTLYTEVPTGMLKWIVHPDRVLEMDGWEIRATLRELGRRGETVRLPTALVLP